MQTIIKPYAETNAVKVVAFAIQLTEQFSLDKMTSIVNATRENQFFKDKFSKTTDQVEVSLTIGPDGVQQHQSTNGILFEKKDTEDQAASWAVSINKGSLVVTCRTYTRWKEVAPKALEIINEVFNIIGNINIAEITLEYHDEFHIINPQEVWKKELFKVDCNYILPSIYNLNSFWHINYGYFIDIDGLNQPLLDNLYINYFADEQDELKHKVNIRAQHKFQVGEDYSHEEATKYFNLIHLHSKSIFEEIITDDILESFDREVQ